MIIDGHCHAGKGDGLTGPWDTAAPLGRYLYRAAKAGIERTVLLSVFNSDYAAANRRVAHIVADRPDRFYGFACVHPGRDRRDRSEGISLDQRRKPDEKRMSAGRRKGRRREPFCPPSLPPGGLLPLVPVPGWTPLPYLYG